MNEKKADSTGLSDGVHKDFKGPLKEAPGASLGVRTGYVPARDAAEQKEEPPPKVREPYELQEQAWKLMDEAVRTGTMILEDGTVVKLVSVTALAWFLRVR